LLLCCPDLQHGDAAEGYSERAPLPAAAVASIGAALGKTSKERGGKSIISIPATKSKRDRRGALRLLSSEKTQPPNVETLAWPWTS